MGRLYFRYWAIVAVIVLLKEMQSARIVDWHRHKEGGPWVIRLQEGKHLIAIPLAPIGGIDDEDADGDDCFVATPNCL